MLFVANECGCQRDIGMTKAREPQHCEHGNLLRYTKALGRSDDCSGSPGVRKPKRSKTRRRSTLRRSQPQRDWSAARAKVEAEDCCRICKKTSDEVKLEAAHILGREHDESRTLVSAEGGGFKGSTILFVNPLRIVPLCGPFPAGCHGDVDHNRINLVHYLTLDEQIQAVNDAGGIAPAFMELAPVSHREEVEASAYREAAA